MESENKKQDCGCSDPNCCTPKKSNLWMKIVFAVIVVAALLIVAIKLMNNDKPDQGNSNAINKSGCDTTVKSCDPGKNPGCCPKK